MSDTPPLEIFPYSQGRLKSHRHPLCIYYMCIPLYARQITTEIRKEKELHMYHQQANVAYTLNGEATERCLMCGVVIGSFENFYRVFLEV